MFLVSGRIVSNMGNAMYAIASMWLVYDLGGSALYSGVAGFLTYLPELFTIFVGPIIDHSNKKRMLISFELLQGILIALIPILSFFDLLSVTSVMIITTLTSFCVQFTYPTESTILPRTVDRKDLVKANSAMAFSYQGTSVLFRSLAGIVIVATGAISIYVFDVFTFVAAAILFSCIKLKQEVQGPISSTESKVFTISLKTYFSNLNRRYPFCS